MERCVAQGKCALKLLKSLRIHAFAMFHIEFLFHNIYSTSLCGVHGERIWKNFEKNLH